MEIIITGEGGLIISEELWIRGILWKRPKVEKSSVSLKSGEGGSRSLWGTDRAVCFIICQMCWRLHITIFHSDHRCSLEAFTVTSLAAWASVCVICICFQYTDNIIIHNYSPRDPRKDTVLKKFNLVTIKVSKHGLSWQLSATLTISSSTPIENVKKMSALLLLVCIYRVASTDGH